MQAISAVFLSALAKRKLVRQATSEADGREKMLTLTPMGAKAVARLNEQSTTQIEDMLANLNAADREAMVAALARVRSILIGHERPAVRIVRLMTANDEALRILEEYYEAVHVVQQDKPASLQRILNSPASGMWLAYMRDEVVGCVVLRKLDSIPRCQRMQAPLCEAVRTGKPDRRQGLLNAQGKHSPAARASHGSIWILMTT